MTANYPKCDSATGVRQECDRLKALGYKGLYIYCRTVALIYIYSLYKIYPTLTRHDHKV